MAIASESPLPPDQKLDMSEPPGSEDAKQFITWWSDRIVKAREFHAPAFKRMAENQRFRRGLQWDGQTTEEEHRYIVNIAQSEVANSVATLYAKNPVFKVKRRPRMDFAIWDEDPKSYEEALMGAQQAMQKAALMPPQVGTDGLPVSPIPPDVAALLEDVNQGKLRRQIAERTARTLELLFAQQLEQQQPGFKGEMKGLVDRVEVNGVGYLKLGFQRTQEMAPEESLRLGDLGSRLSHLENLSKTLEDGGDYKQKAEELRIGIKTLQEASLVTTREGLIVGFPRSTALIIDTACTQLSLTILKRRRSWRRICG